MTGVFRDLIWPSASGNFFHHRYFSAPEFMRVRVLLDTRASNKHLLGEGNMSHRAEEVIKMEEMEGKSLNNPDEVRTFDKGKLELVNIGGRTVGRATFQPGWRWSQSLKPFVNTKSCEAPHFQYHVSGTLRVRMDDGTEKDFEPGDVSYLKAGHDGWVVGDEPVVVVDFQGMLDYATGSGKGKN